jgi:Cu/Ag efflux protein CusF
MKHHFLSVGLAATTCASLLSLALAIDAARAQSSGLVPGKVVDADQSANEITIRHGPIKKLGMDHGMTMVFHAQDPAMLKQVKAGDQVKFNAEDRNGDYSVTVSR